MASRRSNRRKRQPRRVAAPTAAERIALYLDLENLLYEYRQAGDWEDAVVAVASLVHRLAARGTLVARVASGDAGIVRKLAFALDGLGIRTHVHRGGIDAADQALLRMLDHDVPMTCGTVVIASGDHVFAPSVRCLREQGKRVEVVACRGTVSAELYASADSFHEFLTIDQSMSQLIPAEDTTAAQHTQMH
jgi:NYN domain